MDALSDMLLHRKPAEPPQLKALREYVALHYNSKAAAGVSRLGYTLTVANASLAATLRMELPSIAEKCQLDKKLFIRIGHIE